MGERNNKKLFEIGNKQKSRYNAYKKVISKIKERKTEKERERRVIEVSL